MTNKKQEIEKAILDLMEQEAIAQIEYDNAETISEETYKEVIKWEHLYQVMNEDEVCGAMLDKLYGEHYKRCQAQTEACDKLGAIQEVLNHLREAVEIIKRWEL